MTIYPYFLLLPKLPASKSPLAAAVRSLGPQWHPTRKIGAMVTEELHGGGAGGGRRTARVATTLRVFGRTQTSRLNPITLYRIHLQLYVLYALRAPLGT